MHPSLFLYEWCSKEGRILALGELFDLFRKNGTLDDALTHFLDSWQDHWAYSNPDYRVYSYVRSQLSRILPYVSLTKENYTRIQHFF